MKHTRRLLPLLAGLLLLALLAGCTTKEQAPPLKIDEETALNLIWNYEMHMIEAVKEANPYQFVTGLEKQWLDQYLVRKKAGEKVSAGWQSTGSVVKVDPKKVTSKEAEAILQMGDRSVTFKLVPENGAWRVANHTTPEGAWWAPAK